MHATVYIGSNYVPRRRMVFTLGCLLLVMLDGVVVYQLLMQSL